MSDQSFDPLINHDRSQILSNQPLFRAELLSKMDKMTGEALDIQGLINGLNQSSSLVSISDKLGDLSFIKSIAQAILNKLSTLGSGQGLDEAGLIDALDRSPELDGILARLDGLNGGVAAVQDSTAVSLREIIELIRELASRMIDIDSLDRSNLFRAVEATYSTTTDIRQRVADCVNALAKLEIQRASTGFKNGAIATGGSPQEIAPALATRKYLFVLYASA